MASTQAGVRPHHVVELISKYSTQEGGDVGDPTLSEVLALINAERDASYPIPCPKCGRAGIYPAAKDNPNNPADETPVTCDLCNGWGQNTTVKRPIITGYEDVLT
jgi:hypothetical protein